MSTKHAVNVFEGEESYKKNFRFSPTQTESVCQILVLVYVNRAHLPSDQHWLFYERFSRDVKINRRVIK